MELGLASYPEYRRDALVLATQLRRLRVLAAEHELTALQSPLTHVLERLERQTFTVAVIGEFKRGKSTLINAMLGQHLFPADVLPCTASLNRVTHGLRPRVLVRYKDGRERTLGVPELAGFLAESRASATGSERGIAEVVVHHDTHFCRNGVDIIDTPGLGDEPAMTATTLSVLPRVDIAIMVISALAPFSQTERRFVSQTLARADLARLIVVVNEIDRLNNAMDADRVVTWVKERLARLMDECEPEGEAEERRTLHRITEPRVFGVSAYQALDARLRHDAAALERSGLPQLTAFLERFLTEGAGPLALEAPIARVLRASAALRARVDEQEGSANESSAREQLEFTVCQAELVRLQDAITEAKMAVDRRVASLERIIAGAARTLAVELGDAAARAVAGLLIDADQMRDIQTLEDRVGRVATEHTNRRANELQRSLAAELHGQMHPERTRVARLVGSGEALRRRVAGATGWPDAEDHRRPERAPAGAATEPASGPVISLDFDFDPVHRVAKAREQMSTIARWGWFGTVGGVLAGLRSERAASVTARLSPRLQSRLARRQDAMTAATIHALEQAYIATIREHIERHLRDTGFAERMVEAMGSWCRERCMDLYRDLSALQSMVGLALAETHGARSRARARHEAYCAALGDVRAELDLMRRHATALSERVVAAQKP